jgi:hypothetical protein
MRKVNIPQSAAAEEPRIRAERQSHVLIEAFPARRQALNTLSPAWLQAHGQAQVFVTASLAVL